VLSALSALPAAQQPPWAGHLDLACIRAELADLPALVDHRDIVALREELAGAAAGLSLLLHVGECAELFSMANRRHVIRRTELYRGLARRLAARTGRNVVLVARMAGQHGKPRSHASEVLPDGVTIPVYRGDAINSIDATAAGRTADPWRLLTSYDRSRETLDHLQGAAGSDNRIFISHEALIRDYEEPLTRGGDQLYAASAHLLWVGDRTRALGEWHIRWVASIANPVAVKVGPSAAEKDVTDIIRILDPRRDPGRLSLITRMGAAISRSCLEPLARTVAQSGSPVLWQCDPMHGNTRRAGAVKLRLMSDIRAEITTFVKTLRWAGIHPGGLHLEVTPDDVIECCESSDGVDRTSWPPCDPRLNPAQAMEIIEFFADAING
jgi:3-deoxy-7-phosphoheptulonate synthase